MKKLMIVIAAVCVALGAVGGLFDNVSGIANTLATGNNSRQKQAQESSLSTIDTQQIDASIEAMPKTESFLSYQFGNSADPNAERHDETCKLPAGGNDPLLTALNAWFSEVSLHHVSDGSLEEVKLVGEHKKYTKDSRIAMYTIVKYLEHNFNLPLENEAKKALDLEYSSWPQGFRNNSSDSRWSCELDTNYGKLYLIVKDENARGRAREAAEERARQVAQENEARRKQIIAEQEERARQEQESRQKEEQERRDRHNRIENERKQREAIARQREAEEREAQKMLEIRERKANFYRMISSFLDGRGAYLPFEVVAAAQQFPENQIVTSKVPLFKSIVSGSTLLWTLGEYDKALKEGRGTDVRAYALNDAALVGFDYDGLVVSLSSRDTGLEGELSLYCTTEGIWSECESSEDEDVANADKGKSHDIEVFGIAKVFPNGVTADEVMNQIKGKYQNLRLRDGKSSSMMICYDIPGMKCNITRIGHKFASDTVRGSIEESDYRFEKIDLDSDEAKFLIYTCTLEVLKKSNMFVAAEFEKSFNTNLKQVMADVKNGKFNKELGSFQLKAGNIIEIVRGEVRPIPGMVMESKKLFAINRAAKATLSERSISGFRKDATKRAMAELSHAQSEVANGKNREVLSLASKNVRLKVFDAKALEALPKFKQKRIADKLQKEQEKKDAKKANALNF